MLARYSPQIFILFHKYAIQVLCNTRAGFSVSFFSDTKVYDPTLLALQ